MDINEVLYLCTFCNGSMCLVGCKKKCDSMTCEIVASLVDFILRKT